MSRTCHLSIFLIGLAGCQARPSPVGSGGSVGLALSVELVPGELAGVPRAVKLTFENKSGEPVTFQEPSAMGPGMPERPIPLCLVLTDARGRECQWTPRLTELFESGPTEPQTRNLTPGQSWSQVYDLDQLYVWGPCGPASPVSEFLQPGLGEVTLQAMVGEGQGSHLRSQPVKLTCAVANWLFEEPGSAKAIASAHADPSSSKGAGEREERRRHAAALRWLRKRVASDGKEPEQEGKPITEWLEQYCDESARWADEDEPAAIPRLKARDTVLQMGTLAVPFLMAALELAFADKLSDCSVELLRELHEAGKLPEQVLLDALRSGSENARRGILETLDSRRDPSSSHPKPATLSPALVSALVRILQDKSGSPLFPRHLAASALGRPGLKDAVPALTEALKDGDAEVRGSAAQALAAIGADAREAVPALRLLSLVPAHGGFESRAARNALIALGEKLEDFSDFCEQMDSYSHARIAREPVRESAEAQLATTFPGAAGIFFVVDRSGTSMPGVRLAQRHIPRILSTLGEEDEFGIVFVDRNADAHPAGGKPAMALEPEKDAAFEFVLNARGGHGSCVARGFEAALEFCEASRARRKVILYIGDGGGTCQGTDEPYYLERMCDEVTRRNAGRAEIHAIGVDAGPCGEGMLLFLTERNGGTYTRLVRK